MAVFEKARGAAFTKVLMGDTGEKEAGYFVQPTLIVTEDVNSSLMVDEFFGPIATAYVYPDGEFEDVLRLIDGQGTYGLTGSVFSRERKPIATALASLRHAAGNFYINDKPTGAVVGQQPFGGGRASGTNDKAGFYVEPDTMGFTTGDQGNIRATPCLPLSVYAVTGLGSSWRHNRRVTPHSGGAQSLSAENGLFA